MIISLFDKFTTVYFKLFQFSVILYELNLFVCGKKKVEIMINDFTNMENDYTLVSCGKLFYHDYRLLISILLKFNEFQRLFLMIENYSIIQR